MRNSEVMINESRVAAPWVAVEPVVPVPATDPRSEMNDHALVVASRNAFPVVAQQKTRRDNMGVATGAAIALVLGSLTFISLSSSRNVENATGAAQPVQPESFTDPRGLPAVPPGAVPADAVTVVNPQAPYEVGPMPPPQSALLPETPRAASPVMVYDGSIARGGPAAAAEGSNEGQTPGMLSLGGGEGGAAAADTAAARSTRIADTAHTVAQGTLIPAVLETAINSDIQGYVRAVVSQDIRSFDGSQILVPRSSRLIGEYKSGLAAGQKRVYLIWTRLLRPDGVSVALASPSVDFSGQAGVGGRVNNHFLARFGSAILLSVLGGASALASGGSTVVVSGGQSAASMAVQRDGQRGPTIHVRPGEPIRVFTARDLIFAPTIRKGA